MSTSTLGPRWLYSLHRRDDVGVGCGWLIIPLRAPTYQVQRHSVRLYISPPITSHRGLCRAGQPNITFWMVYTHSQGSSFTGFWLQPVCSQAQCAACYQLTYILPHPSHSHAYAY